MLTLRLKSGILQIVQVCVLTFYVFEKKNVDLRFTYSLRDSL